jgi:hypothetical protein
MGIMVDKKVKKHFLGFHTVFNVHENVQWLEEFLIYYINLGFTQFYLYDNTNCHGRQPDVHDQLWVSYKINGLNKYGFKIKEKPSEVIKEIIKKYKNYITYIKWEPRDKNNEIFYGQPEAINHLIDNFSDEITWCAFFDLDEFIFSPNNSDLICLLKNTNNTGSILLKQKKFLDRHLSTEKFITQEFKALNLLPHTIKDEDGLIKRLDDNVKKIRGYGHKHIVNIDNYKGIKNIHTFVNENIIKPRHTEWRFNHYNSNHISRKWINDYLNLKCDKLYSGEDTGMKRYSYLFV